MARLLRRHTFRRFAEIHLEIRSSRGQIIAGFSCGSAAAVRIRRAEVPQLGESLAGDERLRRISAVSGIGENPWRFARIRFFGIHYRLPLKVGWWAFRRV